MQRSALLNVRRRAFAAILLASFSMAGVAQATQDDRGVDPVPGELAHHEAEIDIDSGWVVHPGGERGVIWEAAVHVPDARWLRLVFDDALLGESAFGGNATQLRVISGTDGAIQLLNSTSLAQWRRTSAYFNGDLVIVQIISDAGAEPSQLKMSRVIVGDPPVGIETICGPTDDRIASADPRAARALGGGVCTAWLIDDVNNNGVAGCFLSAGHCVPGAVGAGTVMQFNVPLSTSGGSVVFPGPEDQYVVDPTSLQSNSGGVGNDWAYFGCFRNSTTGLTALEAQGDAYTLAASTPAVSGQTITITGYGSDSGTANFTEQTHSGPYFQMSVGGTWVRYQTDTTGGNSGSAVEVTAGVGSGTAIGIHTHGGCQDPVTGTGNYGTSVGNAGLQNALANPQGICWPCYGIDSDFNQTINVSDLLALLAAWGSQTGCNGDGNTDGVVNVTDLLQLLAMWGPCPPGSATSFTCIPSNNDCENAIPISNGLTNFDTDLASTDGPAHSPTCDTGGDGGQTFNDIWFIYTATCTGTLTVSTCENLGGSADYDTDLVVYSGTDCNSLNFLGCNDDDPVNSCGDSPDFHSTVQVPVVVGNQYLIRAGGWNSGSRGTGSLLVECN